MADPGSKSGGETGGEAASGHAAGDFSGADVGTLPPPSLSEVSAWEGRRLEDIDGAGIAKVSGCFVDAGSGEPAWLLAKLGRFGGEIAIPLHDCAAVGGKVWVPYHRDVLREAPVVDPTRPLNREQELTICEHFGLVPTHGRAAEVSGRDQGTITSRPPS